MYINGETCREPGMREERYSDYGGKVKSPQISIIIPTHNRPKDMAKCLIVRKLSSLAFRGDIG